MALTIDLGIKFIPEDTNVFIMHSGKGRNRFEVFKQLNKILLDMPGLRLSKTVYEDENKLIQHIRMAKAIRDWVADPQGTVPPSRQASTYPLPTDSGEKASIGYSKNAIYSFFNTIKSGDLIIAPAPTIYEPFLAGFVTSDASFNETLVLDRLPQDPFPARSVQWFEHSVSKRQLSVGLAQQMEKTKVINHLDLDEFGPELFTALFGSYIHGETAGLDIHCPSFRGRNPLETIPVQELIAFFVAANQILENHGENYLDNLDFSNIIRNFYDEDLIKSLGNEFHSPGFFRIITKSKNLAIIISLGMALAAAGCYDVDSIDSAKITGIDAGTAAMSEEEIRDCLKPMIEHISPSTLSTIQKKGKEAKEDVGARTSVKISG